MFDCGNTRGSDTAVLQGTVQSPQFQQALSMFSIALQSGQLAPLVSSFVLTDQGHIGGVVTSDASIPRYASSEWETRPWQQPRREIWEHLLR